MASQKSNKDSVEIVRCYCPVCDMYLGTKVSDETKVFKGDSDCGYDWVFFPGSKKPKAMTPSKPPAKCGCGGCDGK